MGFKTVSVLGAGLIGGSIAAALFETGAATEIMAFDKPENFQRIQETGWFTGVTGDIAEAVAGADLTVICLPVKNITELLPEIAHHSTAGSLVIDTGSTKKTIMNRAATLDWNGAYFIGGHPLAGKEVSGIEHSDAGLFKGRIFYLVQDSAIPAETRDTATSFAEMLGGRPVVISAEKHDKVTALLSHFPQILSVLLINWAAESVNAPDVLEYAGPGFSSMVRLAGSDYTIWKDIFEDNHQLIRENIESFAEYFNRFAGETSLNNLGNEFDRANTLYESYIRTK